MTEDAHSDDDLFYSDEEADIIKIQNGGANVAALFNATRPTDSFDPSGERAGQGLPQPKRSPETALNDTFDESWALPPGSGSGSGGPNLRQRRNAPKAGETQNQIDLLNFQDDIKKIQEKKEAAEESEEEEEEVRYSEQLRVRFGLNILVLDKLHETCQKRLFSNNFARALNVISMFQVEDLWTKVGKMDPMDGQGQVAAILEHLGMSGAVGARAFKRHNALEIVLAFLVVFSVPFELLTFLTMSHPYFHKKTRLNFKEERKSEEGTEEEMVVKKKRRIKVGDSERNVEEDLVMQVVEEMKGRGLMIRVRQGNDWEYPRSLERLRVTDVLTSLKGQSLLGLYSLRRDPKTAQIAFSDLSVLELPEKIWAFLIINLKSWKLHALLQELCQNNAGLTDAERARIESKKANRIPESDYEFRLSDTYTLKSILKTREHIPIEIPPTGLKFNEQDIYLKKDVLLLRTRFDYRLDGLTIKEGEKPLKTGQGFVNKDRLIELFAPYQTEPLVYKVVDGKLPQNQWGNIEVFVGLPEGCVHLKQKGIWRACKKLGVDYKEAVIGFDFHKKHLVAEKQGVVIFAKDKKQVLERFAKMQEEIKEAEAMKTRKESLKSWKKVIGAILVTALHRGQRR